MRWSVCFCLLGFVSCTTPRYVGQTIRDGSFVHRGFGLYIDLSDGAWRVVQRGDQDLPVAMWPNHIDGRLDLDGDGKLEDGELSPHQDPTVRLLSTTATGTFVDIRVRILGPDDEDATVEQLLRARQSTSSRPRIELRTVRPRYEAAIGQCTTCGEDARLLAAVDQPGFEGERGPRRQVLMLRFRAEAIGPSDFDRLDDLLSRIVLASKADSIANNEVFAQP